MKRTAAFSLIEVLCAVAILGIAVLGLTRGLTTGLIASKEAQLQTTASLIAASRIEMLRADGFLEEGTDQGDMSGDLANYRWKQTIAPTDIRGLYDVTVRVENSKSDKLIYELETLLFDPPADLIPDSEREKRQDDNRRRERRRT